MSKRLLVILCVIVLLVIITAGIWWVLYLKKAHSSFENYYAFRDCTQLIEKTSDYGICKVKSGETIKIVKYQGRWFLDGDLPGVW